jgi:hypothetical protein
MTCFEERLNVRYLRAVAPLFSSFSMAIKHGGIRKTTMQR